VAADAVLASLQPRFAVEAHLTHLFDAPAAEGAADAAPPDDEVPATTETGPPLARQPPEGMVTALTEHAEQRHDLHAEGGHANRAVVSGSYQRTAEFRVRTTDPDASSMALEDGRARLGD